MPFRVVSLFSKDVVGSIGIKNPFLGPLSLLFDPKQGNERQGMSP